MTHTLDLHTIAREMKAAQDKAWQIKLFTSQLSAFDVASAYRVAHLIHQARLDEGAFPVGRKIGFTNPDMWTLYGVQDPIWSYVYDTTVVRLSGTHATCHIGGFAEPKIEPEIVVHFRSAPPVGGDLSAILTCIDWFAHGIEIVQSHFPGWKFRAADAVADGALHGTLLVGQPHEAGRLGSDVITKLENFSVGLLCNGEVQEMGRGSNAMGSPLAAVAHLTTVLANQPDAIPLQENELVTTGTLTTALSIRSGETWRTELEGIALPGICIQFVP